MAPSSAQQRSSQRSRERTCVISARPRAGSAYQTYATEAQARLGWNKIDVPGGRKLWCRLVSAFFIVAVLGSLFIILGAVYFKQAYDFEMEHRMSLPLVWCIIGIVSGTLMVIGSIILGKLIISNKWRKNQQPNYPNMAQQTTVRYHVSREPGLAEVEIDLPPPYEASQFSQPPPVYIINADHVNLNIPPGANIVGPPPDYIPVSIPDYADIAGLPPPSYEAQNALAESDETAEGQNPSENEETVNGNSH